MLRVIRGTGVGMVFGGMIEGVGSARDIRDGRVWVDVDGGVACK